MRQLCIEQAYEQGITLDELQNLESAHNKYAPTKTQEDYNPYGEKQ